MSFLDSIRMGVTGLKGYQTRLDVLGNNISNSSTIGFKKSDVTFQETYTNQVRSGQDLDIGSTINPLEKSYGLSTPSVFLDVRAGNYVETGNLLDLAIQDAGFFIMDKNGEQLYTRDGNLALDANKNLVQESSGAFLKGWAATMNADGSTSVDTSGPLDVVLFENLQKLPSSPTTEVLFKSNLSRDTDGRSLTAYNEVENLVDPNGNIQTFRDKWTQTADGIYEYEVFHGEERKVHARTELDSLGNILGWKILNEDDLDVSFDETGQPQHLSWKYPSLTQIGITEDLTMTLTLPSESHAESNLEDGLINTDTGQGTVRRIVPSLRAAHPSDSNFNRTLTTSMTSEFQPGTYHSTLGNFIDSVGVNHQISVVFEHVSVKDNIWEYRTYLAEGDPLIQSYLKNPDSGVVDPKRPSKKDIEAANNAIFGKTRIGRLQFGKDGFPDKAISEIPTLRGGPVPPGYEKAGSTILEDPQNPANNRPLDVYYTPAGDRFNYELLLPATDSDIQRVALQEGITDPSSMTTDQLRSMNEILFKGSNAGHFSIENGKVIEERSSFGRLQANLSGAFIRSPIDHEVFEPFVNAFEATPEPTSGQFEVTYNMDLVSGFGGPFSTSIRASDGYVEGDLVSTTITSTGDGTLEGFYDNGEKRTLGQIGLTIFTNTSGLRKRGENLFAVSNNTGFNQDSIGKPNQSTRGLVLTGFLELSNVDLAEEFTDLIVTQRIYQANSKSVTTSDSILQTAIGMKS